MVSFVSIKTPYHLKYTCVLLCLMKCYPFTVLRDFGRDFIRMLMFCATNFVTRKEHRCMLSENAVLFVKFTAKSKHDMSTMKF